MSVANQLYHLSCSSLGPRTLISMLDRLPQLQYLSVKLDPPDSEDSNDDDDEDEMFEDDSDDAPSPETFRLLNLHSLLIESYGISSGFIETHLLPRMAKPALLLHHWIFR